MAARSTTSKSKTVQVADRKGGVVLGSLPHLLQYLSPPRWCGAISLFGEGEEFAKFG
jgi:hypothetical protein